MLQNGDNYGRFLLNKINNPQALIHCLTLSVHHLFCLFNDLNNEVSRDKKSTFFYSTYLLPPNKLYLDGGGGGVKLQNDVKTFFRLPQQHVTNRV